MTRVRRFLHRAEFLLARTLIFGIRRVSPDRASTIGGTVTRAIGPLLPVSRVADANLRLALPQLNRVQRRRVIAAAWENLGRTVAEFPHLGALRENTPKGPGWSVRNSHILKEAAERGGPVIFVSGHIGNWEIMPLAVARYGLPFASFYRAAGNPLIDGLIRSLRQDAMKMALPNFPKGAQGARQALRHLAKGGHLGILADQKMNDGIEVEFFGLRAMTASAAATFALRYQCPVITGYVRRLGPARLELVVEPMLTIEATADRQSDIARVTQALNDRIESAIRCDPGAWLWLHRRWPKDLMPKPGQRA